MIVGTDPPITVATAWDSYEEAEQELWSEYASERSYTLGRCYVLGENRLRRVRERRISKVRRRLNAEVIAEEMRA